MLNNKKLIIIFLIAILAIGTLIYSEKWATSCLELKTGNIGTRVNFPSSFISKTSGDIITLYRKSDIDKNKDNLFYIVGIDAERNSDSVDSIIENSINEAGPKYTRKVSFNGYSAALAEVADEQFGIWYYYKVPVNDRVIRIHYHPTNLSERDLQIANNILNSIKFVQTEENLLGTKIGKCGL